MSLYVREYDWMWTKLGLSLAECRVYAYIYGLSYGENGGYNGSKRHLAEILGLDAGGVKKIIDVLMEKHLIVYTENIWRSVESVNTETVESVNESVDSVNESVESVNTPHTPLYNKLFKNNKKESSVSRKGANTQTNLILTKKYFEIDMETLSDALKRKDSMQVIWSLLNPAPEFQSLYNDFMRYWNKIERDRQLQIWYFLKRKIDTKQPLDPNPFEVLKHCMPYPINYNGDSRINSMIKSSTKMVKAYYQGRYGTYELMDARLWHMTRIEPLNYKDPKTPRPQDPL